MARDSFIYRLTVPASAIDNQGRANNAVYLIWIQQAAEAHSDAMGYSLDDYVAMGQGWVVKTHHLEYLRPAFEGDELEIETWISELGGCHSVRKCIVSRQGKPVLKSETVWTWVNLVSGRPCRIPEEVKALFTVIADEDKL